MQPVSRNISRNTKQITTYLLRLQELVRIFYCYPLTPSPLPKFHFKTVRNFCHSNLECIIRSLQQNSACGRQLSKTLQYCSTKALPPDGSHIRYSDGAETPSSFRNLITRRCFVTTLLAVLELLNALACVYTTRMTSRATKLII